MAPPADDPPQAKGPSSRDDEMARYLAGVQLDALDLGGIELERPDPAPTWALGLCGLGTLINAIGILLFPWTATYQLHSYGQAAWLLLFCLEVGLGALLARGLRMRLRQRHQSNGRIDGREATVVREAADGFSPDVSADGADGNGVDWAQAGHDVLRVLSPYLRALASAADKHRRGLLFGAIVLLVLLVAFVLPHEAQWSGGTYSVLWFLTVGIAAGTGILVGRFIMAAGEASPVAREPLPPLRLPPWMRWVNLGLLVVGALVATFGPALTNATGPSGDFAFAAIGLVTGISGAIWLARRFDEWEAGFKQEAQRKQSSANMNDSAGNP